MAPMRRHVVGPKPTGGPTPSAIRTLAQVGPPPRERSEWRWRSRLLTSFALLSGVVSALYVSWYALRPFDEAGPLQLVGIAVGGVGIVLSILVARSPSGLGLVVLGLFPLAEAVIFALVYDERLQPLTNRWLLVAAASLTLGLLVMAVGVFRPGLSAKKVLWSGVLAGLVALGLEVYTSLSP